MSNEADTCRKYVLPALYTAGWTDEQIGEQKTFTDGRIVVNGRQASRGKPKRADYLLRYRRDYMLAVVEAKASYKTAADGIQQAKEYAEILGLLFAYATNGQTIIEFDATTGLEQEVTTFPSPKALWQRYRVYQGLDEELEDKLLVPYHSGDKTPRYYQQIAINRAVEAILKGRHRVLLTLATGTGKTIIAFQIAWKLWHGYWNTRGLSHRHPRILFLADRGFLVDDPKDKTFLPFGDARHKIENGDASTSREIYFATYQALMSEGTGRPLYQAYASDFFDLVIVDEAHRGSARDDSSWRNILTYFTGAAQLGMTATPLREENRDTYTYFGEALYTYSLKQGIQDGFLAPYEVRRVVINVDTTGFRPYAGQRDDYDREIPDQEYGAQDFERVLSLKARTEAVAHHLTNYLKKTDRFAKTLVFCVDQEHADQMRRALSNANADLLQQYPNYVVRVTANDGEIGKGFLSTFQDPENKSPVILTTSKLLTTGVDAPTVQNVVLFRIINSMVDFKQIIGRGTRVREEYGKLFFTILDYTGSATARFADPDFDGEPIAATQETADVAGNVEAGSEEILPTDEIGVGVTLPPHVTWDDEAAPPRRKFYLSGGVTVEILHEQVLELDASGKRLRTVELTTYTGEQVRSLYSDLDSLRSAWAAGETRTAIVEALQERGISLEHVAAIVGQPDADPFDLLCHLAFAAPLHTRRERAERLRKERAAFFARYAPAARVVLEDILTQYAEYGPAQIVLPQVLQLPRLARRGNTQEIAGLFGGAQQLRAAVTELQTLLYAA